MIQKFKDKLSQLIENILHRYLVMQIKGYINREVGKIARSFGLGIGYKNYNGINVYIHDPRYCDKRSKDPVRFIKGYEVNELDSKLKIGSYKYNEMFWLLVNIKDECYKMGLDINRYARVNDLDPLTQRERINIK